MWQQYSLYLQDSEATPFLTDLVLIHSYKFYLVCLFRHFHCSIMIAMNNLIIAGYILSKKLQLHAGRSIIVIKQILSNESVIRQIGNKYPDIS